MANADEIMRQAQQRHDLRRTRDKRAYSHVSYTVIPSGCLPQSLTQVRQIRLLQARGDGMGLVQVLDGVRIGTASTFMPAAFAPRTPGANPQSRGKMLESGPVLAVAVPASTPA